LSKAAISGIVVGGVIGALFLTIFVFFITGRWRKRNNLEDKPMSKSRLVTPYLTPAVVSSTQLNKRSAGLDDGQLLEPSYSYMNSKTVGASTSEGTSGPRQSEVGGLTDLVRGQLEEEEVHAEDGGAHERLVQQVAHLISAARVGTSRVEDVPPSYTSIS
jgi:hypothetical protein